MNKQQSSAMKYLLGLSDEQFKAFIKGVELIRATNESPNVKRHETHRPQ